MSSLTNANTTANVTIPKGLKGGYLYSGPASEVVPDDVETPLGAGFVNLGYVDSEGITITDETDSETLTDMNGDAIATTSSSETHTWAFTLAEVKADSLKEQYGHKNVTDESGMITVKGASGGFESRIYVFEMVMKDRRRGRLVLPNAEHQAIDEISINAETIFGRKVTVIAYPDEEGNSYYYFFQSTETDVPFTTGVPTDLEDAASKLERPLSDFGDFEVRGKLISGTSKKLTDMGSHYGGSPDKGYWLVVLVEPWEGANTRKRQKGSWTEWKPTSGDGYVCFFLGETTIEVDQIEVKDAQGNTMTYKLDIVAEASEAA